VPERIFIVGGPGSGKSTLARHIASRTGQPIHHLDEVARVGGGSGPPRSDGERAADVARILDSERWIVEGVHLGWTEPLLDAADAIIWLDHVAWRRASTRIARRFVSGALAEARRRRGRERFLRLRDYARRLRELAAAVPETRGYQPATTEEALARYAAKVVRCRTADDVAAAVARVAPPP
jgi:adenylate kinase family enzyme